MLICSNINMFLVCLILSYSGLFCPLLFSFSILKEYISLITFTLNYIVFWSINFCAITWKCNVYPQIFQYSERTNYIDHIFISFEDRLVRNVSLSSSSLCKTYVCLPSLKHRVRKIGFPTIFVCLVSPFWVSRNDYLIGEPRKGAVHSWFGYLHFS